MIGMIFRIFVDLSIFESAEILFDIWQLRSDVNSALSNNLQNHTQLMVLFRIHTDMSDSNTE